MDELYHALADCRLGWHLRMFENRILITTLIFLPGYDESIALSVEKDDTAEDTYTLCDCHSVSDFWEARDIAPFSFTEKIARIMVRYGLFMEENSFCAKMYAEKPENLHSALWRFLQALAVLANVDL